MMLIRALRRYASDNGGILAAIKKVARLSLKLLKERGPRVLVDEVRQTLKARRAQALRQVRRNALIKAFASKNLKVLATPHTLYVAHLLDSVLTEAGYRVSIFTSVPALGFGDEVVIVICPQMFRRLPRNMIAFQMEQSSNPRWFTNRYLDTLNDSLAVFDYSRVNIGNLQRMGISYGSVFHMPIGFVPDYLDYLSKRGILLQDSAPKVADVLFYGDVYNERRQRMLNELGQHFNVRIISNLFGAELYQALVQAKVVVNIHYYGNALLETTRIYECLSLGIPVVSETSIDQDEHPELMSVVRFVELGDAQAMVAAVRDVLSSGTERPTKSRFDNATWSTSFYFNRFLLANDLITFQVFNERVCAPRAFPAARVCLSLPETPARRESFTAQGLSGFEIFDGLRHHEGWLGCAMSYKYLIGLAQETGMERITICEDDVLIDKPELLDVVQRYLDSLNGDWDIFVGLISHLGPGAHITDVRTRDGLTFVHLNTMTGMVCNTYNKSSYNTLLSWDPSNGDPRSNTIDRFLESRSQLRIVTALPFIARHAESQASTLWGFGNETYAELIRQSEGILEEKVRLFEKSHLSSDR